MNLKDFSYKYQRRSELFSEILTACSYFLKNSKNAEDVRDYIDGRCTKNNQKKFLLGHFPNNENLKDLIDLVGIDLLLESGIVYFNYVDDGNVKVKIPCSIFNHHNMVMAYKNLYGDNIAIIGRTLLKESEWKDKRIQKYKYSQNSNKSMHLFGLNFAKNNILNKNAVIVVEGQFDCITCHSKGIYNVVAVGGADLSKYQFFLLKRYTNNFYFLLDNDMAGEKGFEKAKKRYGDKAEIQKIILPKEYKDVDNYLKNNNNYDILSF